MTPLSPWIPDRVDPDLRALPKCNLHSHLEGSVRPETLWELAQERGVELGVGRGRLEGVLQVDGSEGNLVDYLEKISFSYQVLKDRAALRRAAFEAAADAAADGVVYFELRAGPLTHVTPELPTAAAIEAMLEGLAQAEAANPITCRLIVSALRGHDPAGNRELAETAVRYRDQGVVGFDLAGDEAGYPASLHAESFRVAREGGLGITVHAGEAGGAGNVRYAVEQLGAARIGHGVRSVESEAVLDLLAKEEITLEICPISNVHTQTVADIRSHPIRDLYDRGIRMTVADDDPVTSRTSVTKELTVLRRQFDFTDGEIQDIQRMGIAAAFLSDEDLRRALMERVRVQETEKSARPGRTSGAGRV